MAGLQAPVSSAMSVREATRFHWIAIGLMILGTIGTHIDAWTHAHFGFAIESFLTPSHYILYASWLGLLILVLTYAARGRRAGRPRREWMPQGYGLFALGVGLFWVGGAFDLIWHSIVGFEANFEFTLSPSHLTLLLAAVLAGLGPLRHALALREGAAPSGTRRTQVDLALTIGMAILLTKVTWPTWYYDPLTIDFASGGVVAGRLPAFAGIDFESSAAPIAGASGMLVITVLLVSFLIVALHRWRLPLGAATFILLFPALLRALAVDAYVFLPAILGAAIVAEAIWAWIRRGGEERLSSPIGYRVIAVAFPAALLTLYFTIIALVTPGVVWPIEVWLGIIFLASGAGGLLGLAMTLAGVARSVAGAERLTGGV
jgi:hypothetical protein